MKPTHALLLLACALLMSCSRSPSESPEAVTPAPETETVAESSEENTTTAQPTSPTLLKSGAFQSGEHPTEGTARIIEEDGSLILELDDAFQTSTSGPDLVVALHRSKDVLGNTTPPAFPLVEGEYVVLEELQSYSGSQRYSIPQSIAIEDYASAVIWCRRFNATFGSAPLEASQPSSDT